MNIDATLAIIIIAALGALFYGPWQDVCTSFARQVAFEKRDAIFDLAQSGRLSFDSTEYRTIRESLEQLIRFAHELTLVGYIVEGYALTKQRRNVEESHLSQAINKIEDRALQEEVRRLVWRAHRAMLLMMLAKSPFTLSLAIIVMAMKAIKITLPPTVSVYAAPAAEKMQVEAEQSIAGENGRHFALAA